MLTFRNAAIRLLIASAFLASGAAQAQSPNASSGASSELTVEHVKVNKAMDNLFEGVRQLREATLLLLRKEEGPDRDQAIQATQDALFLAERAMLELPPELRIADSKTREAKDWPLAMARLDEATQELERSANDIKAQTSTTDKSDAIATLQKAMQKVQAAMSALPEWTPTAQN